jgi:hypothetical protein
MLTHTTAKGLQQELVRRSQRPHRTQSGQELSPPTVNWRRLGVTVAAAAAAVAIVAATHDVGGAGDVPADPVPGVRSVEDASHVNGSTPAEEFRGGMSGGPLRAN